MNKIFNKKYKWAQLLMLFALLIIYFILKFNLNDSVKSVDVDKSIKILNFIKITSIALITVIISISIIFKQYFKRNDAKYNVKNDYIMGIIFVLVFVVLIFFDY